MNEGIRIKFSHVKLISCLQDHPLYKNQAAKFATILGSFYSLTISGMFREWQGPEASRNVVLREWCRDALGQVMDHSGI